MAGLTTLVGRRAWKRHRSMPFNDLELTPRGMLSATQHGYVFHDDFWAFTVGASGVSGWIKNEVGSGTGAAVQDLNGGIIKFVTGSSANDNISYQWGNNSTVNSPIIMATGKRAWLSGRFATEDADQDQFHLGLMTSQTNPFATEPADQFRFRSGATPDALQFAVGTANSTEVTISLGSMTDGAYARVLAYWDGIETVFAYRFDDTTGEIVNSGSVSVTASTTADLLPDGAMTFSFGGRTADTGADDYFFDTFRFVQER